MRVERVDALLFQRGLNRTRQTFERLGETRGRTGQLAAKDQRIAEKIVAVNRVREFLHGHVRPLPANPSYVFRSGCKP